MAEYATNVGLGLLDRARPTALKRAPGDRIGPVNLLSARHLPRPIPIATVVTSVVLAIAALAAVFLSPVVDRKQEAAEASADLLTISQRRATMTRLERLAVGNLERQAREHRATTLELKSRIEAIGEEMAELGEWFNIIETITETTRPEGVKVLDLTPAGDRFSLAARSPTLGDALQYAQNIRRSGLFTEVSISNAQAGAEPLTAGRLPLFGELEALAAPVTAVDAGSAAIAPTLSFLIEARARRDPRDQEEDGAEQ
jgi:hypothetical protein